MKPEINVLVMEILGQSAGLIYLSLRYLVLICAYLYPFMAFCMRTHENTYTCMQDDVVISVHAEEQGKLLTYQIEGLRDCFWSLLQSKEPKTEPSGYYSDSQVLSNPIHP